MTDWSSFSIGNAAGFIKGPSTLFDDLLRSGADTITLGSFTLEARGGNPEPNYWSEPNTGTSLNALGLPNPGIEAACKFLPDLRARANAAGKKLAVSIAGFTPNEYRELAKRVREYADIVEVNLGCPNVWGTDGQKPIASFDPGLVHRILEDVDFELMRSGPDLAVKLSPFSNPDDLFKVAKVLRPKSYVTRIVTCNTFANGIAFDEHGRPALAVKFGGVGGTALRALALGQVAKFAEIFASTETNIVGVGGISQASDIASMRYAGASGIQVGTAFGTEGAHVFKRLLTDLTVLTG